MPNINPNAMPQRPGYLPEKFWDAENQSPRLEELVRSYLELERRAGQAGGARANVPASPDAYQIVEPHPMCGCDAAVNARLHQAGFTNEQAQLVYDLAHERLLPIVDGLASEMQNSNDKIRLHQHFGGEDRFNEVQRQLSAWGKANLPPDIFAALSTTADGVLALERMMGSGEPGLKPQGGDGSQPQSEEDLKRMVADPRYWRQRDPAYMAKVTEAFKRAYSNQN
jgi:hypothetical protein